MVMGPYSTEIEHLKHELAHERAFFVMNAFGMTILQRSQYLDLIYSTIATEYHETCFEG